MTVYYPTATNVQGMTKIQGVASIADMEAPDLSSEISAVGSVDLSCYLDDWNVEIQQNEGSAPARLCTTVQLPVPGNTQFSAVPITYVYDPQAASSTNDNKAKALLSEGSIVYFVVRKGLDADSVDWAAGQYVEVYKVRCGRQNFTKTGTDEFAEYRVTQKLYPLNEPTEGVQIVA